MSVLARQVTEYVEDVLTVMELDTIRGLLVGVPGQTGLSVEQRKRLTIAVELVANPSVVFMDEPTSGGSYNTWLQLMSCTNAIRPAQSDALCTWLSQWLYFVKLHIQRNPSTAGPAIHGRWAAFLVTHQDVLRDRRSEAVTRVRYIQHSMSTFTLMLCALFRTGCQSCSHCDEVHQEREPQWTFHSGHDPSAQH